MPATAGITEPIALVLRSVEVIPVRPSLVVVAFPCTSKLPVVVAPPLIVSPPACVPLPMVEEAFTTKPMVEDGAKNKVPPKTLQFELPPPPVGQLDRQSEVRQMVVAEIAVDDAYGKIEAAEVVATKRAPTISPTTESLA